MNTNPEARAADDAAARAQRVLVYAQQAAVAYERPDLADRLELAGAKLADDSLRVMVVGEFKHGKSSLLNAMLGRTVCPVDDDIATSSPVIVRAGTPEGAEVVIATGDGDAFATERIAVGVDELGSWATEAANPDNRRRVRRVEVRLDHPILRAGLTLIDTPGVGGLGSVHGTVTAAALPLADAVLFVSDAAQELSAAEVAFLRRVRRVCPHVLYVTTKIDLHHHWRRIVELDDGHLAAAGIDLPHLAVSATLRELALATGDASLADDSGFGPLLRWLGREVSNRGRRRAVEQVANDVLDVTGQLAARFEAERAALADPAGAQALVAGLEKAQARADALRAGSARWQMLLSDGFSDLSSDVDHDQRQRLRELGRLAEETLDETDPADTWGEFEPWLCQQVAEAVGATYLLLFERAQGLAADIAALFGAEADAVEQVLRPSDASTLVESVAVDTRMDLSKASLAAQGMTVLRSSYMSMGMFTTLAGLAGVTLSGPAGAVIGLVMGRKGLRDEKERQLGQRRAQAKAAARRYLDDVGFVVGKDLRDTLRHVQRDLRDHFQTRAEESYRSAAEAVASAQQAVATDRDERARRLADAEAELARLGKLAEVTQGLLAEAQAPDPAGEADGSTGGAGVPSGATTASGGAR